MKQMDSNTRWRKTARVPGNARFMPKAKLFPCLALILLAASAVADTALHDAVRGGDAEQVRELLAAGADVNATDDDGYTPLHRAVLYKAPDIARLLIEAGADVNATDDDGSPPLFYALWGGEESEEAMVRLLIEYGADVNGEEVTKAVRYLALAANEFGDLARDAPHLVSRLRLAGEVGVDMNLPNERGYTPLFNADAHVVPILIEAGADLDAKMPAQSNGTLLHGVIGNPHPKAARIALVLIQAGADLNARDDDGKTPLHKVVSDSDVILSHAQWLLEAGATVDARNNDGQTPLHKLAQVSDREQMERSPQLATMLLAYGADPNASGNSGRTPLHYAVENDNIEVARELLYADADLTASGTDGLTPLHLAAHNGFEAMARFLIESGADLTASDADGLTPANMAARQGHYQLARLLRE